MLFLPLWLWLWIIGVASGTSEEFPNPQKEFLLCGRRNASFICDPEFILEMGEAERLNHLAEEFKKSTMCVCSRCDTGVSLGIFVRRSLTPESQKLFPDGKGLAEMLRKRWHLGKCNDDIVIVLLTEMNISDYSMGSPIKEILPEKTAKMIMNDCRIHFLSYCYYQGLESVVSSFNDVLVRLQKQKKSLNKSLIVGVSLGIGVLLILLLVSVVLLRRQSHRKKGCSNIYESVPTKSNHEDFLNDKISEYHQLEKVRKLSRSDAKEESDHMEDDVTPINPLPRQFLQIRRQLSDVLEESDDNETSRENLSFNTLPFSNQGTNRPLQITEL